MQNQETSRNVFFIKEFAGAYCTLGLAYGALKRYSEAIIGLALIDAVLYRYDEAVAHFKQAIQLEPKVAQTHFYLGITYSTTGRREDAIISFKEGLAIKPDDVDARLRLGRLYVETGDKKAATEQYEALKELKSPMAESLLK